MVPAKLLVGGAVAVGSVSTAVVVANQYGLFSLSGNQTQSSDNATSADEKPKQKEIEKWLTDNDNSEGWKIQIKKTGNTQGKDFKDSSITESDLNGLKDYLDSSEKELLKSLFSALEPKTLTFEKTDNNWKLTLAKENIKKWIEKTSGNKATLKFSEGNEAKDIDNVQEEDLNKLLKNLFDEKSSFTEITTDQSSPTKNILFEKTDNGWKHSKKEIKSWEESNKFEIKIKKGNDDATALDQTDEENLVGLLNYLKTNETQLSNYKNPTENPKASLTLKKETNWDVIYDQNTINNWVNNTSEEKASLEIWEKGKKKELSSLDANGFKELLNDLEAQKNLFQENLGEATKQNKKTIIFEKYTSSRNDKTLSWTHIKTAIKDKLKTIKIEEEIKIKNESETSIEMTNDNELTGLLNYLETNSFEDDFFGSQLIFKKTNDTWQEHSENQ